MSYLCVNYNSICKLSPRSLKSLHPDNQDYLREHRWPPVWYLKDYDYYQRCMNELNRELNNGKKDCTADDKGCLCFSGGKQTPSEYQKSFENCFKSHRSCVETWNLKQNTVYWHLLVNYPRNKKSSHRVSSVVRINHVLDIMPFLENDFASFLTFHELFKACF